jgi:hypothetical protein
MQNRGIIGLLFYAASISCNYTSECDLTENNCNCCIPYQVAISTRMLSAFVSIKEILPVLFTIDIKASKPKYLDKNLIGTCKDLIDDGLK